ncbi:MAG: aminotransferase class III-fold pyridoxal phosphate-dependent enzyme [Bacillota bacterium]|nr:aminotransferase class III-fold pyridoxal phosphate-dependent enzyme [Bacillota bacterium]
MSERSYNLISWCAQGHLKPLQIERAEGLYFYDAQGKRYADMSSQLVNLNIGHGNQKVAEAVYAQMQKLPYLAPNLGVDTRSEAARRIVEKAPANMAKVFFVNAGAEANENAIKIARMFTGRTKIFSGYRSYHGASYGAANLTGESRRFASEPGIPGFVKFWNPHVYQDILPGETEAELTKRLLKGLRAQIEAEQPEKIAALFLESIVGSNGILIPPEGYMQGVRALCSEYGIMMVCDEVMTGFGRTGTWFAVEHFAIQPDIMTIAKGSTCGYVPLGGVIVSQEIADFFDENKLWCGLTYSGHPVGCAAVNAVLTIYEEEHLIEASQEQGVYLLEKLKELQDKHAVIGNVRGKGLFCGVEFVKDRQNKTPIAANGKDPDGFMKNLLQGLLQKGFYTYHHDNVLIIAPPFIITKEQIDENVAILDEVLCEIASKEG